MDLEGAWQRAADDIVAAHNARVDVRAEQEAIGPRQRWALEVLRDPSVAYAPGAEEAEEALSVGRSSTVRKALGDVHARVESGELTLDQAATQIVAVVEELGLRSVEPPLPAAPVTADDLGVVCWMAVLPAAADGSDDIDAYGRPGSARMSGGGPRLRGHERQAGRAEACQGRGDARSSAG